MTLTKVMAGKGLEIYTNEITKHIYIKIKI